MSKKPELEISDFGDDSNFQSVGDWNEILPKKKVDTFRNTSGVGFQKNESHDVSEDEKRKSTDDFHKKPKKIKGDRTAKIKKEERQNKTVLEKVQEVKSDIFDSHIGQVDEPPKKEIDQSMNIIYEDQSTVKNVSKEIQFPIDENESKLMGEQRNLRGNQEMGFSKNLSESKELDVQNVEQKKQVPQNQRKSIQLEKEKKFDERQKKRERNEESNKRKEQSNRRKEQSNKRTGKKEEEQKKREIKQEEKPVKRDEGIQIDLPKYLRNKKEDKKKKEPKLQLRDKKLKNQKEQKEKQMNNVTKKLFQKVDEDKKEKLEAWNQKNKNTKAKDYFILEKVIQQNNKSDQIRSSVSQIDFRRDIELSQAKEKLMNNASIIWLFVLNKKNLDIESQIKIQRMYKGEVKDSLVPICSTIEEMVYFLDIKNAMFKIVVDIENMRLIEKFHDLSTIFEFHIFNEKKEDGIKDALNMKRKFRKVKSITYNLFKLLERVQDQIQFEIALVQDKNKEDHSIKNSVTKTRFPSFLKLSGEDKAEAILYRANLYGSIKLPEADRVYRYMDFMNFIYEKQHGKDEEKQNINYYGALEHLSNDFNDVRCHKILNFYTQQTFYYRTLNAMLRTVKTPEEFKSCSIPFNENYHAIRHYYKKTLQKNKRRLQKKIVYRGVRNLKPRDLEKLNSVKNKKKISQSENSTMGSSQILNKDSQNELFIEMYGFFSTSEEIKQAHKFMDQQNGLMFVIHIPEMVIPPQYTDFDHGFVALNDFNISDIEVEKEVLFNPLNIFKVMGILEKSEGGKTWTEYHLQYGVIFDLLIKKQEATLTPTQEQILINYQYCTELEKLIEDEGDVYMIANDPEASKEYYERKKQEYKHKNKDGLGKACLKLAVIHHHLGQLSEAQQNAEETIKIMEENIDKGDRQKCMKVFGIHSKNAEINVQNEDYLNADQEIENGIKYLSEEREEDKIEKGRKIRERGEIKFKKGQIGNAEEDFKESESVFEGVLNYANQRRNQIKSQVFLRKFKSFFTCRCSQFDSHEEWREKEEAKIRKVQNQIQNLKKTVDQELLKVVNSVKEVAIYVEDKSKYQNCVVKARGYLAQMKTTAAKDPYEKAKLKVVEATVKSYLSLAESENLVEEAIQLVEKRDPYNENVGKYCEVLAKIQKNHLDKLKNPKASLQTENVEEQEKEEEKKEKEEKKPFDDQEEKKIYEKCEKNYEKAINILLFHNKSETSPQILGLRNQLSQLHYNVDNFQSCQKVIQEIREERGKNPRSEVAKATFLLSKISYSRGQLKLSFEMIKESEEILREALVKTEEGQKGQEYKKIFERHETHIEAILQRSKVYSKQLKHDLSLKEVNETYRILKDKFPNIKSNSYISQIYLYKGEIKASAVLHGRTEKVKQLKQDYHYFFKQAIAIVQRQRGANNVVNASIYCSYIQSMLSFGDLVNARKTLERVAEIVSSLPINHPVLWPVFYCYAIYQHKKQQKKDSLSLMRNCLDVLVKKFDPTHISISKVRLQFTSYLEEVGDDEEFDREYENFQHDLFKEIQSSQMRESKIKFADEAGESIDEKKLIRKSLREIGARYELRKSNDLHVSSMQLARRG